MTESRALTVTLNPALDFTVQAHYLELGKVNIAAQAQVTPGGKGINVARVLADLGVQVTAMGLYGEENRDVFDGYLAEHSINNAFISIPGSTRVNVKLKEREGRVTDVNMPGLSIDNGQWQAFVQRFLSQVDKHDLVVLGGSLPPGVAHHAYAELIEICNAKNIFTVLDSSGEGFKQCVSSAPSLVKPNLDELSQWFGSAIVNRELEEQAVSQLLDMGIDNVVVSDGGEGSRWYTNDERVTAKPPAVTIASTVGAGDSLVAGICYGQLKQHPKDITLKYATAISACAVEQVGVGILDSHRLHQRHQLVQSDRTFFNKKNNNNERGNSTCKA